MEIVRTYYASTNFCRVCFFFCFRAGQKIYQYKKKKIKTVHHTTYSVRRGDADVGKSVDRMYCRFKQIVDVKKEECNGQ